MDFQTLTRRELQSLCKLNKIPANLTNVAMAEALQSLQTVVGIEEYLNATQSETGDVVVVQSVEVVSPKAPQTRCRSQKVKPTETETLQTTVTRTTRRGSKQPPKEVEESKNDSLKTPGVSRTTRKVPVTSTRRNVSNRLSECETEVKKENKYSTRRSTRMTEKKSAVSRENTAVKIDSILDQGKSIAVVEDICNAFDVVTIEEEEVSRSNMKQESFEESLKISSEEETDDKSVEEDEVKSELKEDDLNKSEEKDDDDDLKPESYEEVCDEVTNLKQESFEVISDHNSVEEDEDCAEVKSIEDDLKNSEEKDDEMCDLNTESDEVCDEISNIEDDFKKSEVKDDLKPESETQFENENLVQKLEVGDELINPSMVQEEEHCDENDACEDESFQVKENDAVVVLEENTDNINVGLESAELELEDSPCADSEMLDETNDSSMVASSMIIDNTKNPISEIITKEMEDMSVDVITMTEEDVEDLKPEFFTENLMNEKSEADSRPTPIKKATPFKSMIEEVKDQRFEVFTENNHKSDADSDQATGNLGHVTPFKGVVTDDKENNNNSVVEVKILKKDANDMSIRQLKKLLKAMTLNTPHNSKEEGESVATKRTALHAVCENQMMVGGENEN